MKGRVMSMNSSRTSVGIGSSMQIFGRDRASRRRTSSIVYSLKPVNIFPLHGERVEGSAARTFSTLVLE